MRELKWKMNHFLNLYLFNKKNKTKSQTFLVLKLHDLFYAWTPFIFSELSEFYRKSMRLGKQS